MLIPNYELYDLERWAALSSELWLESSARLVRDRAANAPGPYLEPEVDVPLMKVREVLPAPWGFPVELVAESLLVPARPGSEDNQAAVELGEWWRYRTFKQPVRAVIVAGVNND